MHVRLLLATDMPGIESRLLISGDGMQKQNMLQLLNGHVSEKNDFVSNVSKLRH
jgi:hypothetical protein